MGTCQLAIRSFSVDKARIYNCQQSQFPSLFFQLGIELARGRRGLHAGRYVAE